MFPSSTGTPLDGRNMVRETFEPARRRAKLPAVRFHDLRHSYASVLIAQGTHPKVISEQLGHASVQITMDRYSHLFDGAISNVGADVENAWGRTETASGPASAEGQNGAAAFRVTANTSDESPAKDAI